VSIEVVRAAEEGREDVDAMVDVMGEWEGGGEGERGRAMDDNVDVSGALLPSSLSSLPPLP
jgi:hypothetical protein